MAGFGQAGEILWASHGKDDVMSLHHRAQDQRGITVLTLLLIIIAVIIAAVFLVRYLKNRPAPSGAAAPITASIV